MHISEAYEHEPLLPYQGEDTCPVSGCDKTGNQCLKVSAPLTFTPTATVGKICVTCQGMPEAACTVNGDGESCTVTLTQRVCVSIPVRFGVTLDPDFDPTIRCAEDCADGGSC